MFSLSILPGTCAQMLYGRLYLNSGFFKELAKRFKRNIVLILAERDGKVRSTCCTFAFAFVWNPVLFTRVPDARTITYFARGRYQQTCDVATKVAAMVHAACCSHWLICRALRPQLEGGHPDHSMSATGARHWRVLALVRGVNINSKNVFLQQGWCCNGKPKPPSSSAKCVLAHSAYSTHAPVAPLASHFPARFSNVLL